MNVTNPDLTLIRVINSDCFRENSSQLWIGFGGSPQATTKDDAYYVGLNKEAPTLAITHIGIVDYIARWRLLAPICCRGLLKQTE
jgi:hypothetical protein